MKKIGKSEIYRVSQKKRVIQVEMTIKASKMDRKLKKGMFCMRFDQKSAYAIHPLCVISNLVIRPIVSVYLVP